MVNHVIKKRHLLEQWLTIIKNDNQDIYNE